MQELDIADDDEAYANQKRWRNEMDDDDKPMPYAPSKIKKINKLISN